MDENRLLMMIQDLQEKVDRMQSYIDNIQIVPPLHNDDSGGTGMVLSIDQEFGTLPAQTYLAVATSAITAFNPATNVMGSGTVEIYGLVTADGITYTFTDAAQAATVYNLYAAIANGTDLILVQDSGSQQLVPVPIGSTPVAFYYALPTSIVGSGSFSFNFNANAGNATILATLQCLGEVPTFNPSTSAVSATLLVDGFPLAQGSWSANTDFIGAFGQVSGSLSINLITNLALGPHTILVNFIAITPFGSSTVLGSSAGAGPAFTNVLIVSGLN